MDKQLITSALIRPTTQYIYNCNTNKWCHWWSCWLIYVLTDDCVPSTADTDNPNQTLLMAVLVNSCIYCMSALAASFDRITCQRFYKL